MGLSPETERALSMCYDAIAAPQLWLGALDNLAHSMGAHACQILPHVISQRSIGEIRSTGAWRIEELWLRNQDWATDVYVSRGEPFVLQGYRAVLQSQLFTDEEVRHSRFHQEITKPVGCLHWACGIFQVEDRVWCLPFFRGNEPFTANVLQPIAEVAGRMAHIVSLAEKISRADVENEVITFDRAGCAAMLIDKYGRVTRVNHRAENLFCRDFGIRKGRLWTAENASLERLDRFMAEIELARSSVGPLPTPVIIARNGTPWLLIEAMPVTSASNDIFDGYRALLVVSDLSRASMTNAALLSLVFGLTSAEARLAAAICEGQDLTAASATFGVSRETLRSQLKTVFAKTGSRRQAELVARAAKIRSTAQH